MIPHQSEITAMRLEYDIVVEAPDRTRVLVVECKRTKESSDVGATKWRRNLQVHGLNVDSEFFLLAFPTKLFLWKAGTPAHANPDFSAPSMPVLKRYLGRVADQPRAPLPESLEIAFSTWLSDLANGVRKPDASSEPERMLVQSGLLERIKGGRVRTQVVA
jgi:hypothetical protein